MPGYEPFLLCDFHVHTRWSDGRLSLREVVDLYGKTRRFDVIAITDHILMERDMFARAGRMMSLGRREFSVTAERFDAYLTHLHRVLWPELIVIGGGVVKHADKYLDRISPGCEVRIAELGNLAGIVGAALMADASGIAAGS